jgi:hypothetical protein
MRIKPDGTLDGVWREPAAPWRKKTPEQRYEEWLNDILRKHPGMTREEAKKIIDLFG